MSLHEEITGAIQREIDALGTAIALSPTSLALGAQRRLCSQPIEPRVQYTSLEHLKQLAHSSNPHAARAAPGLQGPELN